MGTAGKLEQEPSNGGDGETIHGHDHGEDGDGEWAVTWRHFFKSSMKLLNHKQNQKAYYDLEYAESSLSLADSVISSLVDVQTVQSVPKAVSKFIADEDMGEHGQKISEMLRRELDAIATHCDFLVREPNSERRSRVSFVISGEPPEEIIAQSYSDLNDEAIDDILTGVGSIEDLLGKYFPKWVLKLLKVYKEIMSIAKGG